MPNVTSHVQNVKKQSRKKKKSTKEINIQIVAFCYMKSFEPKFIQIKMGGKKKKDEKKSNVGLAQSTKYIQVHYVISPIDFGKGIQEIKRR